MLKTLATVASAALALAAISAQAAKADAIPYPSVGSVNTTTYTFTAASTGDLVAYIVGGFGAGYSNDLGVLVNGTQLGGFGLNNHSSSVGDSIDFGAVTAGDSLVFILDNLSLGKMAYSDPTMNVAYDDPNYTGSHNHVYSTNYTATSPLFSGVPTGTYVAFEDLPFPGADFNYNDESFVFSNTDIRSSVPEPATWAVMLLGFGGLGAAMRSRRQRAALA